MDITATDFIGIVPVLCYQLGDEVHFLATYHPGKATKGKQIVTRFCHRPANSVTLRFRTILNLPLECLR